MAISELSVKILQRCSHGNANSTRFLTYSSGLIYVARIKSIRRKAKCTRIPTKVFKSEKCICLHSQPTSLPTFMVNTSEVVRPQFVLFSDIF